MYLGQPLREVYPHATTWQVLKYRVGRAIRWFMIRVMVISTAVAVLTGVYFYGAFEGGRTISVINNNIIAEAAVVVPTIPPVLERIAQAESHKSHFCTEALVKASMCKKHEVGQVLQHVNTNGSIDIGYYQINSVHGATAAKLGYNLTIEADNKAFAEWLYANEGTEPWYSSEHNWR